MKKREADFGVTFRHWIRANPPKVTCHFELKCTEKYSIPFNCLELHQIEYGEALRDSPKGVLIRNVGSNGEPDYTYSYRDPVFVVIKFPATFCIIPLAVFMREKSQSKRKSLTLVRAQEIASETIYL